jgi:phosphoglycolate phosphatase-like HAD superfamily hydrolase
MKVVLFDIDGTLLRTNGAGRRAVNRAIHDIYGTHPTDAHEFDGKTDPQIVRELMRLAGAADDSIDDRLSDALARYLELLHVELGSADHSGMTYPGVGALLDVLERRDDVLIGLLTGNIHGGAMAKLNAVGLGTDRFKIGAFGSDHASRPELPAIARSRAVALLGHDVDGRDVIVIGDTPADMSCGLGIGARAIGVATGRYTIGDLAACAPHAVFADLSDTAAVMRAIFAD